MKNSFSQEIGLKNYYLPIKGISLEGDYEQSVYIQIAAFFVWSIIRTATYFA